jgi:hypothetical protein
MTDDKVRTQAEHEQINAREYPSTRQICALCDEPTERCEEDSIHLDNGAGPLCIDCYHKSDEYRQYLSRCVGGRVRR